MVLDHKISSIDHFADDSIRNEITLKSKSLLSNLQPYLKSNPTNTACTKNMGGNKGYMLDNCLETQKALAHIQAALNRIPACIRNQPLSNITSHSIASRKLTYQELAQHLISLRMDYIQRIARPLVQKLMAHPKNVNIFNTPVDPVKLDLPTYFTKIKNPMDLGTVRSKIIIGEYENLVACYDDIRLVFNNAVLFNGPEHYISKVAKEILKEFEHDIASLQEKSEKDCSKKETHSCKSCFGSLCLLCGERCLKLETPSLFCSNTLCGQRIKKNGIYYVSPDGLMMWCQKCQSSLPPVISDGTTDLTATEENPSTPSFENTSTTPLLRKHLMKRRFDEDIAEPWVECDRCKFWYHQICCLYDNLFVSKDDASAIFVCPLCQLESGGSESTIDTVKSQDVLLSSRSRGEIDDDYYFPIDKDDMEGLSKDRNSLSVHISLDLSTMVVNDCDTANSSINDLDANTVYTEGNTTIHTEPDGDTEEEDVDGNTTTGLMLEDDELLEETLPSDCEDIVTTRKFPAQYTAHSHWKAKSLPRTQLSNFLESLIKNLVIKRGYASYSNSLCVRMTSNIMRETEVPACVVQNLRSKDGCVLPNKLPYRQKCIQLFQNIDGVDVSLFCLYVQEFDANCPPPNTSTVYIAYLDSVDYFRPPKLRTAVYQEMIVGYLLWSQARGFNNCHFWSCPPQRGDNFIFWCHPSYQKTPSRDRLNTWYTTILHRAKKLGVHSSHQNRLWEDYFSPQIDNSASSGANGSSRKGDNVRQAAKRSFVNSGKINGILQKKKMQKVTSSLKIVTDYDDSTSIKGDTAENDTPTSVDVNCPSAKLSSVCSSSGSKKFFGNDSFANSFNVFDVPICPPIFEGDYWLGEFQRLFRVYSNRCKKSSLEMQQQVAMYSRKARDFMRSMYLKPQAALFREPVDPVALNIPTYPLIIKNPMDLGTIRNKLRDNKYITMLDLLGDIRLTFDNAMKFNPPGHVVHALAKQLLRDCEKYFFELMKEQLPFQHNHISLQDFVNDIESNGQNCALLQELDKFLATCPLASCPLSTVNIVEENNSFHSKNDNDGTKSLSVNIEETESSSMTNNCITPKIRSNSVSEETPFKVDDGNDCNSSSSSKDQEGNIINIIGVTNCTPPERKNSSTGNAPRLIRVVSDDATAVDDELPAMETTASFDDHCDAMDLIKCMYGSATNTPRGANKTHDRFNPVNNGDAKNNANTEDSLRGNLFGVEDLPALNAHGTMVTSLVPTVLSSSSAMEVESSTPATTVESESSEDTTVTSSTKTTNELQQSSRKTSFKKKKTVQVIECPPLQPPNAVVQYTKNVPMKEPVLGLYAVKSLFHDLGKSIHRLNDDLFIVKFLPFVGNNHALHSKTGSKHCNSSIGDENNNGNTNSSSKDTLHSLSDEIGPIAYQYLSTLQSSTIDPDPIIDSPIVNSRHTFLEMCQYRHYQFDSLRRAKHSSLMILYSLHNPFERLARPICQHCQRTIQDIRWHCEQCVQFELCHQCKVQKEQQNGGIALCRSYSIDSCSMQSVISTASNGIGGLTEKESSSNMLSMLDEVDGSAIPRGHGVHAHPLTPYRVTFY